MAFAAIALGIIALVLGKFFFCRYHFDKREILFLFLTVE